MSGQDLVVLWTGTKTSVAFVVSVGKAVHIRNPHTVQFSLRVIHGDPQNIGDLLI